MNWSCQLAICDQAACAAMIGRTREACGAENLVEGLGRSTPPRRRSAAPPSAIAFVDWVTSGLAWAAVRTCPNCGNAVIPGLVAVLDVDVEVRVQIGVDELRQALDEGGRGQRRDVDPHVLLRFVAQLDHVLVGDAGRAVGDEGGGGTRSDQLESVELLVFSQFMNRMSENGWSAWRNAGVNIGSGVVPFP